MHLFEQTVKIDDEDLKNLTYWLTDNSDTSERLNEDDTFVKTAKFEDGMEMDIKCCGVQLDDVYNDPASNTAWTEAILSDSKGSVCRWTDASDEYLGDWEILWEGNLYRVRVVRENKQGNDK